MTQHTTLVWFRQDLRIKDNPALQAACDSGSIIPVFIYDKSAPSVAQLGGASKWWLHHSLMSLNESLGGNLLCFKGCAKDILFNLATTLNVDAVMWNRCYEPWQINRDKNIKQQFQNENVECKSFNGSLLWEPWTIHKSNGDPYKVYTPYYRKGCLVAENPRFPLSTPEPLDCAPVEHEEQLSIEQLALLPTISWDKGISKTWTPGEQGAEKRLQRFLTRAAEHYRDLRNFPSAPGTSMLSPHLHWGEISPNQIWYATLDRFNGMEKEGIDTFLSEIGWREFSYYLLYHFPELQTKNFSSKFDVFPWRDDPEGLARWQKGNTGIPIVDAGMRELWQTGYMHNRVRMIVGSFLVKNLLIDWRHGEQWFWDCLCDADMASNSASWQWVAGCGADAAPYFRIFNPVLQGEKFDKEGEYVKKYCPELTKVPKKFIHKPWDAPKDILKAVNVTLGEDYPQPIVDLKESRERALAAFETTKQQ